MREWKKRVKARDGYKCQMCGETKSLQVHHIRGWTVAPSLRYNVNNGITLCYKCHNNKVNGREEQLAAMSMRKVYFINTGEILDIFGREDEAELGLEQVKDVGLTNPKEQSSPSPSEGKDLDDDDETAIDG